MNAAPVRPNGPNEMSKHALYFASFNFNIFLFMIYLTMNYSIRK
ncbi:hypothetical protein PHET_12330 [Paragonimus heterotremus]|uniref:Uncharacterized protein n=1 Tax=Paragonimus heterotremus TaxID=100268 RepID=A0A8J4T022_9TREM|nr:hypothetical protein PHET_12330 [Paragonimus heterotremus]